MAALFALSLLVLVCVEGPASPGSSRDGSLVVVSGNQEQDLAQLSAVLSSEGFSIVGSYADIHAVVVRSPLQAEVVAARLASVPGVKRVEAVQSFAATDSPAEPYFTRQSAYLQSVQAQSAWDIEKGNANVIVAVVDTGLDVQHPDLAANVWFNPNEIANNGVDDDANGCVDDLNGCAFVTDSLPGCSNITNGFIRDDIGHGTFVAGIIAAPVNGKGIAGIARNVRVMGVKVLDCFGSGDSVAVARGILYAARNGAKVINISLGGLEEASIVNDAVATAMGQYGAVVVAAAGNSGERAVAFPAKIPSVIAVGATKAGDADHRAEFSNYGPGIDVVAPGEGIVSTVPEARCNQILPCFFGDPYGAGAGTSFSAPMVSGLAALLLSAQPSLSAEQVVGIIRATAKPVPDGKTPGWAGAGRIDMFAALNAARSGVPAGEACTVATVIDGESFTCTSGREVRMLQMDAPDADACGGEWARAALSYIFLTPGRTVYLQYDDVRKDEKGRTLAVPIWRGNDGNDYNLSIVMVYVGLARAGEIGAGNRLYLDWAQASERWASAVGWNMWAPGKPFVGGC